MPAIHFNGKTYSDISEMPANEREAYEHIAAMFADNDQNGVPDMFEGDVVHNLMNFATTTTVMVNGQPKSLNDMSPEMRAKLEKGLQKLNDLGLFLNIQAPPEAMNATPQFVKPIQASPPIIQQPSVIQEDSGSRTILIVVVLLAMFLLVVAGLAAFFFMMR